MCANVFLLCWVFAKVKRTSPTYGKNHPTPFLYHVAMTLGDTITSHLLQDAVSGNSKQVIIISYAVLACLNTVATCIGKEATNPDMTGTARGNSCTSTASKQFAAASKALAFLLQQLELTALGGALFPKTLLYKDLDQKRKQDNNKILSAAKQLKLLTHKHHPPQRHGSKWNNTAAPALTINHPTPINLGNGTMP